MRKALSKSARFLALMGLIACCCGWGEDGHRIIGDLATHHLAPEAAKAVADLLDGRTLADISTWADEVRSQPEYKWTERLHYVNIDPKVRSFDYRRDCPTGDCVVGAIYRFIDVLRDPASTKPQKAEALKFLVHFVQDIHQPLHVSPAGDRGGNDVMVEFFGKQANLHETWDSLILQQAGKPWKKYAEELRNTISPEKQRAWSKIDPTLWATESYRLAVTNAHAIPKDHRLGDAYQRRNLPVVEQRLCMGGVRLALLLNAVFGDGKGLPRIPSTMPASASAPSEDEGTDRS